MKLFISPHNDDAVLFGTFTLLRERPVVVTVFDSYVQVERGYSQAHRTQRRAEDLAAMKILGCILNFGMVPDNEVAESVRGKIQASMSHWQGVTDVWLPAVEAGGHVQHNLVGEIGLDLFGSMFSRAKVHRYLTYTEEGKSTAGLKVPCTGAMVLKKLQALACYQSQIEIDALWCWPHFMRDQTEYVLPQ